MGDARTGTDTLNNALMSWFSKRAIKTLDETVVFKQLIAPENMYKIPDAEGVTATFTAWRRLAAPSVVLGEGSAKAAVSLSSRKIGPFTIASYGRAVKYTDLVATTTVISVKAGALARLEQCAALAYDNAIQLVALKPILDQVGRDTNAKTKLLSAMQTSHQSAFCADTGTISTSLQFGFPVRIGGSCNRLSAISPTAPSQSARLGPILIRKCVARLQKFGAVPFADGKFRGCCSPEAWSDCLGNPSYKEWVVNYSEGPRETMMKHQVGVIHNVKMLMSQNMPRYATSALSASPVLIVSPDALAVTELAAGSGMEFYVTESGPQSTDDPYRQKRWVAFKVRCVAGVLNPSAGVIGMAVHNL